jgi:CheY-like chemotaxis protein
MTRTPPKPSLKGLRVLIAEDQYLIAAELRRVLEAEGIVIVGPFSTLAMALAAIAQLVDVALLDVNLHGLSVFALAEDLTRRGIPYGFATAYEAAALPKQYQTIPRVEKPVAPEALLHLLANLAASRKAPAQ